MKGEPAPATKAASPHQKFAELGKKIMAVPKSEVDALEKKWRALRKRKRDK